MPKRPENFPSEPSIEPELPASEIEPTEPLPGEYHAVAEFRDTTGAPAKADLGRVRLPENGTLEELQTKALDKAIGMGLHNFGMDAYVGRYPSGHPVTIILKYQGQGDEIRFTRKFNGSGSVVEESE